MYVYTCVSGCMYNIYIHVEPKRHTRMSFLRMVHFGFFSVLIIVIIYVHMCALIPQHGEKVRGKALWNQCLPFTLCSFWSSDSGLSRLGGMSFYPLSHLAGMPVVLREVSHWDLGAH